MKGRNTALNALFFIVFPILTLVSCSKIKQARDVIIKPTAREMYGRGFEENNPDFENWKESFKNAISDSVIIDLPYSERGKFFPENNAAYSYELTLDQGEQLEVAVETDSTDALVFIDLFKKSNDSLKPFDPVKSAGFGEKSLQYEIQEYGVYKLLIQPETAASSPFTISIFRSPTYTFPVASKGNAAVQSYWGADRDAGRRRHEGIDIFAARGTPVIAATEGRVSSTGNRGLGGKQVWLRDRKRGKSLYYAHLDSIITTPGMKVVPGDTLGLVGNSGNARTTPPHLHFGIYSGYKGAVNPLPYVYQTEKPEEATFPEQPDSKYIVSTGTANLRKGPTTKAVIAGQIDPGDTLNLLGRTGSWYHARKDNQNIFVHESLAKPL